MLRMIFNLSRQYMILCQWLDSELDQGKVQRQKKYIYTKGFTCVFIQLFWNKAHYGKTAPSWCRNWNYIVRVQTTSSSEYRY